MAISNRLSTALEGAVGSPENRDELVAILNNELAGTDANIPNALVKRSNTGGFSAGIITATLVGSASLNVLKTGDTMTGTLNMSNHPIINISNPTSNQDAATKLYVDTANAAQNVTIATNTANIATNTSNIATNTANIATNTADIAVLQGVSLSSNMHTLLTTSTTIQAAATAAGLNVTTYLAQTLATAPSADILIFIKAALAAGFPEIKQQMINAYDAVHCRIDSKISVQKEKYVVTQAQLDQGFIDLIYAQKFMSSRVSVGDLLMTEGSPGGLGAPTLANTSFDYVMNYLGKHPVLYNIVNEVSNKEKTTVLINNIGSFFDTSGAAAKYFTIDSGSPDAPHYFWFKVTNAGSPGTDPTPGGTGFEVDILLADTAAQIATKLNTVVAAQSTLFTSTVATATVTITNFNIGAVSIATAATSGATITRTALGINSNLNNKYMAITGSPINQAAQGPSSPDFVLWFNVDGLGDVNTAYLNSQSGYELLLSGMIPIQVSISSGATAATIAAAIATAIRQNVPTLFYVTAPSANTAVLQSVGSIGSAGTTTTGAVITMQSVSGIVPGMPVTGTGIPATDAGGVLPVRVVSISGLNVTVTPAVISTSTGTYFTFNYLPIKIYKDETSSSFGIETHITPVSTLVNTGGRGFNFSNCFQVVGTSSFDDSMVEPSGRIQFLSSGRSPLLGSFSSPGTIASGSNRVSSFNMPARAAGSYDQTVKAGMFVTGTGIPAGTTLNSINVGATTGFFSVKRVSGTKDLAVWDVETNTPTTIAAYQANATTFASTVGSTLAIASGTGDLTLGSTTILMTSTTGIVAGMMVQGPYIPGGATVVSIVVNTSITISVAALSTQTGQALIFGSCTGVATVPLTCIVTSGSPYITSATATPNVSPNMGLNAAVTGFAATATVLSVKVVAGTTTITMSANASASGGAVAFAFVPSVGMLVSGTGIPAGTFVSTRVGAVLTLSSVPTVAGTPSLTFKAYYPDTILGLTYTSSTAVHSPDCNPAPAAQFICVRSRVVAGGDVLTGVYEMYNDSLIYPYGLRSSISNDLTLSQPATAGSSAAMTFSYANPTPSTSDLLKFPTQPLKVGDAISIMYDVDDQNWEYKVEKAIPFGGPTWDGLTGTIDTWYQTSTSTSTIDMPYKVKGRGVPVLNLGTWSALGSDLYGFFMSNVTSFGRIYNIGIPGESRPFTVSTGGFSEANINDAEAWRNNSSGNPFSDLRISSTIRAIATLIERIGNGPMFLQGDFRTAPIMRQFAQIRPDLVRGIFSSESADNNYAPPIDTYKGSGPVSVWKNVGIFLPGATTSGLNTIVMGSGGSNYTVGVTNGMSVYGTGIPSGATVTAVTGIQVTISAPATATGTSYLRFGGDPLPGTVRGDYIYEYCSSNDLVSSNPNNVTGTTVTGSNVITGITNTTKILKGMSLTGTGVNPSDAPVACTMNATTTVSGISAGDIANIQVGMYVYGGGLPIASAAFVQNALTLKTTNATVVVSKGVSSVVLSNAATITTPVGLLWFVNQVTAVTPTTITMSVPATASGTVTIRGRMINKDSDHWRLINLNSRKRAEMQYSVQAGIGRMGLADAVNTAQQHAGAGEISWVLAGTILPTTGSTNYTRLSTFTLSPPLLTQADDGTHPNLSFDMSTLPSQDYKSGINGFTPGAAFNVQSNGTVTGGHVTFDDGSGIGIDQGSGIYRSAGLSQPFKFYGGRINGWTIHQKNCLGQGDSLTANTRGKIIDGYGADMPNPTSSQMATRCKGITIYRIENANNWVYLNPLSGWHQSVLIGEALQWVFGKDQIVLASANPYNDLGSAPINVNAASTFILQQPISPIGGNGIAGLANEWQTIRRLLDPKN